MTPPADTRIPVAANGVGGRCPECGKPRHPDFRPFCSKRCADVDLGRWLGGRYRIDIDDPDAGPVHPDAGPVHPDMAAPPDRET